MVDHHPLNIGVLTAKPEDPEFGDLILWWQIINEMKARKANRVIFITNDEKEDWWWISDSNGKRTMGLRHELIDEINAEAGVDSFYMYNTERFLLFAGDYFKVPVSQESINQVRDITTVSQSRMSFEVFSTRARNAEAAVYDWILSLDYIEDVRRNETSFPDFVALTHQDNRRIGYDVKYFNDYRTPPHRFKDILYRGYYEVNEGKLDELNLVLVCDNLELLEKVRRMISRFEMSMHNKLKIVSGLLNAGEESDEGYKPCFT